MDRGPRSVRVLGAFLACIGLFAFSLLLSHGASNAFAQSGSSTEVDPGVARAPSLDATEDPAGDPARRGRSGVTPLVAPIPFKNSQLGWGLVLMLGAIHRFDPDTTVKPSTGAVSGFYSENHSWGVMALEMARLAQDSWRLRGLYSHFDLRYDFFGVGEAAGDAGIAIPLGQTMDFAVGSVLRRVSPGFYGGGSILWMRSDVELRSDLPLQPPPVDREPENNQLVAPGLVGEFDTRDDDYWPRSGSIASLKTLFFLDGLGGTREFQRYVGAWSWYRQLPRERLTLATNINAAVAAGDVPFYMLPALGTGRYGLRGYTQGRYRDNVMTTVQAELRFHTAGRFAATVFGGFGQVAPDVGSLVDAKVLPAGGLGARFQLTKNFPMHMRLDYAWGKSDEQFYFSVGEAF